MSKDCRQHYDMATGQGVKPAVKGPPTSDVFEGPGGAAGNIYSADGKEVPADTYGPPSGNEANPTKGRW